MEVTTAAPALKFLGKTVLFAGKFDWNSEGTIKDAVISEGGTVVYVMAPTVDVVITGAQTRGVPAAAKEAEKLNKKGSQILIMPETDFFNYCMKDGEAVEALLRSNQAARVTTILKVLGYQRYRAGRGLNLIISDLRGADLSDFDFAGMQIDACDFSNTKMHGTILPAVASANFSGADISGAKFFALNNCNFDNASFENVYLGYEPQAHIKWMNPQNPVFVPAVHPAGAVNASLPETQLYANCSFIGAKFKNCLVGGKLVKCDFSRASFAVSLICKSKLEQCNFSDAYFSGSDFMDTIITGCDCSKTNFDNTSLVSTQFLDSNLNNANFKNANLAFANLRTTTTSGARFEGCNLNGADTGEDKPELAVQVAAGAEELSRVNGGPVSAELEHVSEQAHSIEIKFRMLGYERQTEILLETELNGALSMILFSTKNANPVVVTDARIESNKWGIHKSKIPTVAGAIAYAAKLCWKYSLDEESIECKILGGSMVAKDFRLLVIRALREAFGLSSMTEAELKKRDRDQKNQHTNDLKEFVALLRSGANGITTVNKLSPEVLKSMKLNKADLSDCDLSSVKLMGLDLRSVSCDRSIIIDANLDSTNLTAASLTGARLDRTSCRGVVAEKTDFSNSSLVGVDFSNSKFTGAKFSGAILAGASFCEADIKGADFSSAKLTGVIFDGTKYDHKTVLPDDFTAVDGLIWDSRLVNARLEAAAAEEEQSSLPELTSFDEFMARAGTNLDQSRLKNALKMLKAESFQLFSNVTDDAVIGVVKSQSVDDLAYACRLSADGKFCCGTQNLNSCGGLRGALCKHLLVLILGLTKTGELDLNQADKWIRLSRRQEPKLDKDIMTEAFLRSRAGDTGDVDWRPTETIPEDYYSF